MFVNDLFSTVVVVVFFTLQCDLFIQEGARLGRTPAEVVSMCDITFSCVSDPKAARDVGQCFVNGSLCFQSVKLLFFGLHIQYYFCSACVRS